MPTVFMCHSISIWNPDITAIFEILLFEKKLSDSIMVKPTIVVSMSNYSTIKSGSQTSYLSHGQIALYKASMFVSL